MASSGSPSAGEWRQLAIALGVTAVFAGMSFALAPGLWLDWPAALVEIDDDVFQPLPIALRLPIAAFVVAWGARSNRPWTVVVAGAIAVPWISPRSLAMLVGVVPLIRSAQRAELT